MSVNGIGQNYYRNNVSTNKHNKSKAGQFYLQKQATEASVPEKTRQNANVQDIYEALKSRESNEYVKEQDSMKDVTETSADAEPLNHESETKTEIIAKPDGSRVLVMTMSIGGMETTMSLEISKPTEAPNVMQMTRELEPAARLEAGRL